MKVILLQDVKKQGKKDQIIDVSDGYAKNYLIAKGLAIPATNTTKKQLARTLDERKAKEDAFIEECKVIAKELEKKEIIIKVKTGKEDKVFGTVSSKQICEELKKMGYDIDKKKINITYPIDSLGTHKVELNLHKKVKGKIKVTLKK